MKKYLVLILFFLVHLTAVSAEESVIMRAMEDELARSMKDLRLDDKEGPYYLSYLVKDVYLINISADSGAITTNTENRSRTLVVDLRVGDYTLDNSNFLSLSSSSISSLISHRLTLGNDYDILRMGAWSATDTAYKAALDKIAKKKVALQSIVKTEELPDFTKGAAASEIYPEASFSVRKDQWVPVVDGLSKLFLKQPQIQKSKVTLRIMVINSYYLNSEGARSVEPSIISQLLVTGVTQADDGMPVGDLLIYTAADPEEFPSAERLKGDVKKMIEELKLTREAPVAEDYNGPVLFMGQAAGELFGQGFGNYFLGRRVPRADNPQLSSMLGSQMGNPFLTKIDRRVAARFLSMEAVPSLTDYNGKSLLGSYKVDDEGVPCSDVTLVRDGILKSMLTSRTPVKGFPKSNGHTRGGAPVPSVIHVTSSNTMTPDELKQELLNTVSDEGLPFGYIVKGIIPPSAGSEFSSSDILSSLLMQRQGAADPTQFSLTKPYSIYKVYPDGKEELVRGLEFRSHSINILKDILATSDDETVYDYPVIAGGGSGVMSSILSLLGSSGASSQYYATVITPSLLISEMDLKKTTGNFSKLPIVDYPLK